jgi:2-iminobutanoate/2-iminopropanoate deaminase
MAGDLHQFSNAAIMTIQYINPDTLASPGGHYSHAVVANGLVFVSGQLPITPTGEKLNASSFDDQARQVLGNVAAALQAAGTGIDKLVQVRVYVTDIAHWPAFNQIYADWAGNSRPARAVVPVPVLHHGFLIEVEAVAVRWVDGRDWKNSPD